MIATNRSFMCPQAKMVATVYAVGIGGWTDEYELRAIASDHYTRDLYYIPVRRFDDLRNFRDRFRDIICNSKFRATHIYFVTYMYIQQTMHKYMEIVWYEGVGALYSFAHKVLVFLSQAWTY